jgi:hypothetical protein
MFRVLGPSSPAARRPERRFRRPTHSWQFVARHRRNIRGATEHAIHELGIGSTATLRQILYSQQRRRLFGNSSLYKLVDGDLILLREFPNLAPR